MKQQKILQFLMSALGLIVVSNLCLAEVTTRASSVEAILDLGPWDGVSVLALDGPWEFYWGQLISPGESFPEPDAMLKSGRSWRGTPLKNGETVESFGAGTYRMRIKGLSSRPSGYELVLTQAFANYKVVIVLENETSVLSEASSGYPTIGNDSMVQRMLTLPLPAQTGKTYEIIIWVSNHVHYEGGLWLSPQLAAHGEASQLRYNEALINLIALGTALSIGIYCFMIWWRRRDDKLSAFLSIVAMICVFRIASTTPLIRNFFPDSSHSFLLRVEYATMGVGGGAYLHFLLCLFSRHAKPLINKSFEWASIGLGTIPFVTSTHFYTQILPIFQIFALLCVSYWGFLIIQSYRSGEAGVGHVALGCLLIILAVIFDVTIAAQGILSTPIYLTPLAAALFLILQSQLVAKRSSDAYAQARHYAAELVEKEKARTLFFHNTSHELRTPLNGIIGFLELLDKGRYGFLEPKAMEQIKKCIRLSQGLKVQVNTILDLAKSRKGNLNLSNGSISLEDIATEAEDLAAGLMLKHKDSKFEISRFWSADLNTFITDREKLRSAIQNLLGNAFKFAASDRPNHVRLALSRDKDSLLIIVSDSGIGIPEDQKELIFKEFHQVAGDARRAYEGTGLGLTMVQEIVELMGGNITVESKLGEGSQFTVRLPEQKQIHITSNQDQFVPDTKAEPQHSSVDFKPSPIKIGSTRNGPRILAIDDHEINCELLRDILSPEGYRVSYALGGIEGLKMMKDDTPDLILLDMMMPHVSGEDVIKEMQADPQLAHIPIILLTARASERDRIHGLGLGVDDYLAKPIHAEELLLRVGNLLERLNETRQSSQDEQNDNLRQIAEIFIFVSNEINSIHQNMGSEHKLQVESYTHLLRFSALPADLIKEIASALHQPSPQGSIQTQLELLPLAPKGKLILRLLRTDIATLGLPQQSALAIWERIISLPEPDQESLENLFQLALQYRRLWEGMHRSKEIFQAAIGFIRQEHSSQCHLWDSLDATISMAALRARMHSIKFEADIKRIQIAIAPMALQQIAISLLDNAMDAVLELPNEERHVRIWVEEVQASERILVKVSHTGPRINEETAALLFSRGIAIPGSKAKGLGLYFSKRLARRFHGDLQIDTRETQTCFVLELDQVKPPEQSRKLAKRA